MSRVSQILLNHAQIDVPDLPDLSEPSEILTEEDLKEIWVHIPSRFKISNLERVFSARKNGYSLLQLYSNCEDKPLLMVIQTMKQEKLGAYLSHGWGDRKPKTFFGNGETFLFRLGENAQCFPWVRSQYSRNLSKSRNNGVEPPSPNPNDTDFFMMGEPDFLVVGGGDGYLSFFLFPSLKPFHEYFE